jgi:hypothetical protein
MKQTTMETGAARNSETLATLNTDNIGSVQTLNKTINKRKNYSRFFSVFLFIMD